MSSTCAVVRDTIAERRFKNPSVSSPRQVIGFDLSAKSGKSGLALDCDDNNNSDSLIGFAARPRGHLDCMHAYSASSKSAATRTNQNAAATLPRSALQQLLLSGAGAPPSKPSRHSFPADGQIGIPHELFLQPASSKASATKQPMASAAVTAPTSKPCTVVERVSGPVTSFNLPMPKGIAQLVSRPSTCNTQIYSSPKAVVSGLSCVARMGKSSCQPPDATNPRMSDRDIATKRNWDAKSQQCEENKKSVRTDGIGVKGKDPHRYVGRWDNSSRDSVVINRNQFNDQVLDKSKRSSLFMLSATSPIPERSEHLFYGDHADDTDGFSCMDLDFLNSCHLCNRSLGQGDDVFMYRGDKAFCSMECRYQQIEMDERKEKLALPVIRAGASPAYRTYMVSAAGNAVSNYAAGTTAPSSHHSITIDIPNFINSPTAA